MMTPKAIWIALTITFFLSLGLGPARADETLLVPAQWGGYQSEQDRTRDAVRSGEAISPGQAKQAALAAYPGRFLDMSFGGNAYIDTSHNHLIK